jgi:PAS domain S-box-containing protein
VTTPTEQPPPLDDAPGWSAERWRQVVALTCSYAYSLRLEPDGSLVTEWVGPGFLELFGFTREEMERPGPAGDRMLHPADRARLRAWLGRILAGEPSTVEHRAITSSGETRWVRNHGRPVRDAGGRVTHVDGAVLDITERVRAEEARRDTNASLQAIVDQAPLAIVVVDYAGVVTAWNPAAERLFGWRADEVLGRRSPLVSAEDWAAFELLIENAFCGDLTPVDEGPRRCKGGGTVMVSALRAVLRDAAGAPIGLVGMMSDATERMRAAAAARHEEELRRRSEANFRTLIELSPDAIAVYQGDAIRYGNPRMLSLLGYERADEVVGKSPLAFVHPDDRPMVLEQIRKYSARQLQSPTTEERFLRKDGTDVSVDVTAIPVFYDDQPSTVVHARDLTDRKRLEAQLVMADRLASVGRLAAAVGHEINNPLAYVLANLDLVLERLGDPSAARDADLADMLREAREGADRVRHIVRDLKVFSRGETEEQAPIDPRRVLDSCVNMARGEIRQRARLTKRYADTPRVVANEARLGQVLLNLLINAVHAIPEGEAEAQEILVATSVDEKGRVVLEVHDTGVGIPEDVRRHIFEPFFTTKTGGRGSGLGLSICQSIVTSLGGEIAVESAVGQGTSFRVLLPAEGDGPPASAR